MKGYFSWKYCLTYSPLGGKTAKLSGQPHVVLSSDERLGLFSKLAPKGDYAVTPSGLCLVCWQMQGLLLLGGKTAKHSDTYCR